MVDDDEDSDDQFPAVEVVKATKPQQPFWIQVPELKKQKEKPAKTDSEGLVVGPKEDVKLGDFKEKAWKVVSKYDDKGILSKIIQRAENTALDQITLGDLAAMSPEFAREMRKIMTRKRVPVKNSNLGKALQEGGQYAFMEDSPQFDLEDEVIPLSALQQVDWCYLSSEEDPGLEPGVLVCGDPVLQYMSTLADSEKAKPIVAAMDSASLRVVFPLVNGRQRVECIVDNGSQIVSMALKIAEAIGLMWDPDVQIFMQSANGQLKKSVGLARNVPFLFGDIPVYLQVHIIDQPAYDVLLGRPFDVLTESLVENRKDGSQTITIRDPNADPPRRCSIPTFARGSLSTVVKPKPTVKMESNMSSGLKGLESGPAAWGFKTEGQKELDSKPKTTWDGKPKRMEDSSQAASSSREPVLEKNSPPVKVLRRKVSVEEVEDEPYIPSQDAKVGEGLIDLMRGPKSDLGKPAKEKGKGPEVVKPSAKAPVPPKHDFTNWKSKKSGFSQAQQRAEEQNKALWDDLPSLEPGEDTDEEDVSEGDDGYDPDFDRGPGFNSFSQKLWEELTQGIDPEGKLENVAFTVREDPDGSL